MPSLMDLSLEILEMVVLQLELVEDVISLGSSCSRLARLVGQKRLWRVFLDRTELVEALLHDSWWYNYDGQSQHHHHLTKFPSQQGRHLLLAPPEDSRSVPGH